MVETTKVEPSRMDRALQGMARTMWLPSVVMGFAIVLISLYLGYLNSIQVGEWFTNGKEVREAAEAGSTLAAQKAGIESVFAWLPGFKFLGMGLLFSGIVFLLATIIGSLREAGIKVQKAAGVVPRTLQKPVTAKLFPMLMMVGLLMLVVNFAVDIGIAATAASYWNHSIAAELNTAAGGSTLLGQLADINATKAWAEPLKFVGISFLFVSIALALATIRKILTFQAVRIRELVGGH